MNSIKKAIIPIAGLGTRFLPLSKVVPKELWPLVDKPMIQYTLEEAKGSGVSEIIFIIAPEKKIILDYFKKSLKIEKILRKKGANHYLTEMRDLEETYRGIKFFYLYQKKPLGDGHAVLLAKNLIGQEPCFVLYPDDIVVSKNPCLKKLIEIFEKYQKPVTALYSLPKKRLQSYGVVKGRRIANRILKIEKIIEKPSKDEISSLSNLAIVGKRIITPEVFDYLEKAKPSSRRGEIGLTETLTEMLKDRKEIYGYEIEGKWLECGNKLAYLKSNLELSLKHPQFGKELKRHLKEI